MFLLLWLQLFIAILEPAGVTALLLLYKSPYCICGSRYKVSELAERPNKKTIYT